jgi:hypothetical protein
MIKEFRCISKIRQNPKAQSIPYFKIMFLYYFPYFKTMSWSGRPARPRPTALLPPRSYGKPEAAAAAVDRLLMMA